MQNKPDPNPAPAARPPTARRAHHQGGLALVLIASAGGLAGCGPDPNDVPVEVSRAVYSQVEDCVQDWGSEADCEFDPSGMDKTGTNPPVGHGSTVASSGYRTGHDNGARWMGPWFSRSGTVYRYDGRVEALQRPPSRATGMDTQTQSANQIYASPTGRYATTAAHPQASPAKAAQGRGGFGGTGRMFSSSGG